MWRCRSLFLCLLGFLTTGGLAAPGDLAAGFVRPPDAARPWVYWFWIDGNITREGITADLEAMERAGLGGALVLDVTQELPSGKVAFFSAEWRALFQHAVREAARLGLQIGMHNSAGWTGSGGPWIRPPDSMQRLIYSVTNLAGPARFDGVLPPLTKSKDHWAVGTIAFPSIVGDGPAVPGMSPVFETSAVKKVEVTKILDDDQATFISLPAPTKKKTQFIQARYGQPFRANRLVINGTARTPPFQGAIHVSDDGRTFRVVREFSSPGPRLSLEFEQVTARYFRVVFTAATSASGTIEISDVLLTPVFRIPGYSTKAAMGRLRDPGTGASPYDIETTVPDFGIISREQTIDLTPLTDSAGRLTWQVPKGRWTIMRFGFMSIARMNHPARPGGLGLESDKLRPQATAKHFDAFLGQLVRDNAPAVGRVFSLAHIDSWEVGYQNWTPSFPEEFRKRRGYDPLPWLPAFSGRVVADAEQSGRFLWDARRTIADLQADHYAGHMRSLAHRHGLKLSAQAYGEGPFDCLMYAGRADIPMAEFWQNKEDNFRTYYPKLMASAAHIYGKPVVAAEAFSAYPENARWLNHPYSFKALADAMFCAGINHLAFHRYAHQPWLQVRPGMSMGPWGVHYERTQTWWEYSRPWHEYVARCQHLLQSGLFAADLCYLTSEEAYLEPPSGAALSPPLPNGYAYDLVTPEVVLTRMAVKNGRLVLPDGMSYAVLVLTPSDRMTPALVTRLSELAAAGATLVGVPPTKSPSLQNYPACDEQVRQVAGSLWGKTDGKTITEARIGNGRVVQGKPLQPLLTELNLPPDFQELTPPSGYPVNWIHRRVGDSEIYFVANSNSHPISAQCAFRVTGKRPEIWQPETGRIDKAVPWRASAAHTILTLHFDPAGSVFVVFREPIGTPPHLVKLTRDGKALTAGVDLRMVTHGLELCLSQPGLYSAQLSSGPPRTFTVPPLPPLLQVKGPWEVAFPLNLGAPPRIALDRLLNLSTHAEPGVRYFSGTATYRTTLKMPDTIASTNIEFFLELGEVQVIAQPRLNGHSLGILWKPPFCANVTSVLKPGDNELEVEVVNLWPNRLVGDELLPDDTQWQTTGSRPGRSPAKWPEWLLAGKPSPSERVSFAAWKLWSKDSPLPPSGLIGPVTVRPAMRMRLE